VVRSILPRQGKFERWIYLLQYILFVYLTKIYICDTKSESMKTVSLKIDELIFGETEKILAMLKMPRNRYINEAIDYYNKVQQRLIIEKKLQKESELVKEESMSVLKEFEDIDYGH
jgi:hypothetical protein